MAIVETLIIMILLPLGFVTGVGFICLIRDYFQGRKTVDTKLGEQRFRDITAEDLGYSIPFSNVPVPEKKWVTPYVEVIEKLEFTGIRAIQL